MVVVDLAVLGYWLNWIILEFFFNLNNSLLASVQISKTLVKLCVLIAEGEKNLPAELCTKNNISPTINKFQA